MPKTPRLNKAIALQRVERELQELEVAGTLIPGDEPISIPGDLVRLLRREFPERSKTWAYDAAAVVAGRTYPVQVKGVIGTMVSSGMNDVNNIQPAERAARQNELKPLRQQWGRAGGRPPKG